MEDKTMKHSELFVNVEDLELGIKPSAISFPIEKA